MDWVLFHSFDIFEYLVFSSFFFLFLKERVMVVNDRVFFFFIFTFVLFHCILSPSCISACFLSSSLVWLFKMHRLPLLCFPLSALWNAPHQHVRRVSFPFLWILVLLLFYRSCMVWMLCVLISLLLSLVIVVFFWFIPHWLRSIRAPDSFSGIHEILWIVMSPALYGNIKFLIEYLLFY